jgi:hypothetical protein
MSDNQTIDNIGTGGAQKIIPARAETTEDRDREFARTFLQFGGIDPNSNQGRGGVEILVRVLEQAREEGRREQLRRDFRMTKERTEEIVDYVARAILGTWTENAVEDWADPLIRENRRIEARAAVKAMREWESVHGK